MRHIILSFIFLTGFVINFNAQSHDDHSHHGHDHSQHNHSHQYDGEQTTQNHDHQHKAEHSEEICGHAQDHTFDAGANAIHHISDANIYNIGPFTFSLPCILYDKAPGKGFEMFSSGKFDHKNGHHGSGIKAYNGYILDGGVVKKIKTDKTIKFPQGQVNIGGFVHMKNEKGSTDAYVCYNNHLFPTEKSSTADFGVFGGGLTGFYDFSITKNVLTMIIVSLMLLLLFTRVATAYKRRDGRAPTGLQNMMETLVVFVQDEVAKPFLGAKYRKFLPFLLTIFFFILGLNLFGQVPFFGGSNVTGNLGITAVLAIIVFFVTNINGNAHYWLHIVWPPDIPFLVKLILIPVELLGLFIKPITLMLRLFANITAGHIVIIIFVSFIFILGDSGKNIAGGIGGIAAATLLTLFMQSIELIVAFVQAFVFTILTASYIGAATEDAHSHNH